MLCDLENASELLTGRELAQRLRLHPTTISKKHFPSVLIGSRRRYHLPTVMRWIAGGQGA